MRLIWLVLAASFLTGCSQQAPPGDNGAGKSGAASSTGGSLLSSIRAKADPALVAKVEADEQARAQQLKTQQEEQSKSSVQVSTAGTVLPSVSQAPFAPPADQVVSGGPIISSAAPQQAQQAPSFWPFGGNNNNAAPPPPTPQVATYGGYGSVPPPPPGGAGGLVPPPPAVSLSTQAQALPGGNSYANPYANQYAAQGPPPDTHPSGSLFGSGSRTSSASDEDDDRSRHKKHDNFVPITPTGMDARSAYKQRDDLKVLFKGAISVSPLQKFMDKDDKVSQEISKIDVGLPGESSKGSFNVSQRQMDILFKSTPNDKKIAPELKKMESDLAQAYYRYLYAYNKFALAQQTVAARKQQVAVAGDASEQQSAAADLSQAQSDADAAREDLKSSQYELASAAGVQAARTVIGRVAGVSPSADSLAQSDNSSGNAQGDQAKQGGGGILGAMGSMFSFGHGTKTASSDAGDADKKVKEKKPKKEKGKEAEQKPAAAQTVAMKAASAPAAKANVPATSPKPPAAKAQAAEPISFELKNVNISPRKSILKVAIRNNGSDNFSFSPDVVSISEGNHKLSEATVLTEFDTTLVPPSQEVTGTITIFGRPWNDRLTVSLNEGGKTIQLRR